MTKNGTERKYYIDRIRIFRKNGNGYHYSVLIMGCCIGAHNEEPGISVNVNGGPIDAKCVCSFRYSSGKTESGIGIYKTPVFSVMFDWSSELEKIELFAESENRRPCIFNIGKDLIDEITEDKLIDINIDEVDLSAPTGYLRGWVWHVSGKKLNIELIDERGEKNPCIINRNCRKDLADTGLAEYNNENGFDLSFPYTSGSRLFLKAYTDDGDSVSVPLKTRRGLSRRRLMRAYACFRGMGFAKALAYYSRARNIKGHSEPDKSYCEQCSILTCPQNTNFAEPSYHRWLRLHSPGMKELNEQRETRFSYSPLISIIVPCYNTPVAWLEEMVDSVTEQTYSNWELCIADASDNGETDRILDRYSELYPQKIKVAKLEENLGISANTNKALELATGEYAVMLDHDDLLTPDALFSILSALQTEKYDVLYSDEDKLNDQTGLFEEPHFKPDFDSELLRTNNYICHLFCARLELIKKAGCFRSEYDGSQDYDMILRCTENGEKICHIPKVLYHWRMHSGSTAEDPESKMYCYIAGEKAIRDHLARKKIDAEVAMMKKPLYGRYTVKYKLKTKPKVSILIPSRDEVESLTKCIDSLYKVNSYDNFEIIIMENNSADRATFDYYRDLKKRHGNVKVVTWKGREFNYSSINNYGVKYADGEYLLLLNNDTSIISPDAISSMLSICEREDVGIVGAKLLYPDNSIQHAGVIVGLLGTAGHAFARVPDSAYGYMCRARLTCCCSAVTGACLLISKKLYEEVGGLNETAFKVAFNDVDLCLRLRQRGYLIVWDAQAYLYHYESKSRGSDLDPRNKKRFENEVKRFGIIWKKVLNKGDPYYNPNWDLYSDTYTTYKQ